MPLPLAFYDRHVVDVARDLLGVHIRRDDVVLRITEVEAYTWPGDTACHARAGLTPRNAALWGPHGRAYVYLCYGMHNMLNIVTGGDADAAAVLIRSCEPVAGHDTIAARRGGRRGPDALAGPGKVAAALALDRTWTDHPVYRTGGLVLERGVAPVAILVGRRIGIDYADAAHRRLLWRFAVADTPCVTQRAALRRLRGA